VKVLAQVIGVGVSIGFVVVVPPIVPVFGLISGFSSGKGSIGVSTGNLSSSFLMKYSRFNITEASPLSKNIDTPAGFRPKSPIIGLKLKVKVF